MRKRRPAVDRRRLLADELSRISISPHGALRLAVGYPNTYQVAQSSLAFQWVREIASLLPDTGVERFYADEQFIGCTFEHCRPLAELDILAWSCSFELDAVNILRTLAAAGVPWRRDERSDRFPLLVVGGPVATINPLPLSPVIDLFCLGPAEVLLPQLVHCTREHRQRHRLLEELADRDGFFVPALHLDHRGRPLRRLRRVVRRERRDRQPVPASHVVTPHTEYAGRALVEISRGCPERCRFCWIGHASGRFRAAPAGTIISRLDQLTPLTRRIGLVATAAGDHPHLPLILDACLQRGIAVGISSLRIAAMVPEVLQPLACAGARSVTIAPEAGNDHLRSSLGKRISNEEILHAVATAQESAIEDLKMYFLIGLPGETDSDLDSIAGLIRQARDIMDRFDRSRGRPSTLLVSISILVPKPYTPLHRETVIDTGEARRRIARLRKQLRSAASVSIAPPPYREAQWQAYLSRAGADAYRLLEEAASGQSLARLLADYREAVDAVIRARQSGPVPWHFIGRRSVATSGDDQSSPPRTPARSRK